MVLYEVMNMQYYPAVLSLVPDFNLRSAIRQLIRNFNIMAELIENYAALWHESYQKQEPKGGYNSPCYIILVASNKLIDL